MGWLDRPQFVQTSNNRQSLLLVLFSCESSGSIAFFSRWFLILVGWPCCRLGLFRQSPEYRFWRAPWVALHMDHGFFELHSRFLEEGGFQFRYLLQGFPYSFTFLHEQASQEIDLDRPCSTLLPRSAAIIMERSADEDIDR